VTKTQLEGDRVAVAAPRRWSLPSGESSISRSVKSISEPRGHRGRKAAPGANPAAAVGDKRNAVASGRRIKRPGPGS
jgi:hypothetical protein